MSSSRSSDESSESESSTTGSINSLSSSSDVFSSDSSERERPKHPPTANVKQTSYYDPYVNATQQWTLSVPIGLGLCPWAIKSHNRERLKIISCSSDNSTDVATMVENEISILTSMNQVLPLSTVLIVCPHIEGWNEFQVFDEFVKCKIRQFVSDELLDRVTLVAFHPQFLKWHALPPGIYLGSTVKSYWGRAGQNKSTRRAPATIIEMKNRAFGLRKVKVRFEEEIDGGRREQYVPTDWIVASDCKDAKESNIIRPPLPDNSMYQSPYPTIHVINTQDLATLCVSDVSRVKRLNASKMAKLGWEGVREHSNKRILDGL